MDKKHQKWIVIAIAAVSFVVSLILVSDKGNLAIGLALSSFFFILVTMSTVQTVVSRIHGVRTIAKVTSTEPDPTPNSNRIIPRVSYTDDNGLKWSDIPINGGYNEANGYPEVGDWLNICYNKHRPEEAAADYPGALWIGQLVVTVIFVVMLWVCFGSGREFAA